MDDILVMNPVKNQPETSQTLQAHFFYYGCRGKERQDSGGRCGRIKWPGWFMIPKD